MTTWSPTFSLLDLGADRLDDAGALVAVDAGIGELGEIAVAGVHVGLADAAVDDLDQHLVGARIIEDQVLHRPLAELLVADGGSDLHGRVLHWPSCCSAVARHGRCDGMADDQANDQRRCAACVRRAAARSWVARVDTACVAVGPAWARQGEALVSVVQPRLLTSQLPSPDGIPREHTAQQDSARHPVHVHGLHAVPDHERARAGAERRATPPSNWSGRGRART